MSFEEMEQALRQRHESLGPVPRAELLHVLMLPDFERANRSTSSGVTHRAAPSPSC
jgi:hypothetical protein